MAEFTEVWKKRKKMCESYRGVRCPSCPISSASNGTKLPCLDFCANYPKEAEEIITKWVEEHPVKTNADRFKEILYQEFGVDFYPYTIKGCQFFECSPEKSCDHCEHKDFWEKEYIKP